jgi:GAF domain-containing protein
MVLKIVCQEETLENVLRFAIKSMSNALFSDCSSLILNKDNSPLLFLSEESKNNELFYINLIKKLKDRINLIENKYILLENLKLQDFQLKDIKDSDIISILIMPINYRSETLGTLYVFNNKINFFTEEKIKVVSFVKNLMIIEIIFNDFIENK